MGPDLGLHMSTDHKEKNTALNILYPFLVVCISYEENFRHFKIIKRFSVSIQISHCQSYKTTRDKKLLGESRRKLECLAVNLQLLSFYFQETFLVILHLLVIPSGPLFWCQSIYRTSPNETVPWIWLALHLHELN